MTEARLIDTSFNEVKYQLKQANIISICMLNTPPPKLISSSIIYSETGRPQKYSQRKILNT